MYLRLDTQMKKRNPQYLESHTNVIRETEKWKLELSRSINIWLSGMCRRVEPETDEGREHSANTPHLQVGTECFVTHMQQTTK